MDKYSLALLKVHGTAIFFGLSGVWLAQPVADVLTAVVSFPIALQYTSHLKKLEAVKL